MVKVSPHQESSRFLILPPEEGQKGIKVDKIHYQPINLHFRCQLRLQWSQFWPNWWRGGEPVSALLPQGDPLHAGHHSAHPHRVLRLGRGHLQDPVQGGGSRTIFVAINPDTIFWTSVCLSAVGQVCNFMSQWVLKWKGIVDRFLLNWPLNTVILCSIYLKTSFVIWNNYTLKPCSHRK